jgi:hypothetical protein
VADARATLGDGEAASQAAERGYQGVRQAVVEAHARGDEEAVGRLSGELTDAERELDRLSLRLDGLRLAVRQREQEERRFLAENVGGLLKEHASDAQAARERLRQTFSEVQAAFEEYRAAEARTQGLITASGQGQVLRPQGLPFPVQDLIRQVERTDVDAIPAPLPAETLATMRVVEPADGKEPPKWPLVGRIGG